MIVKNESKVIERCLNSLKDKIDYWVIIDTGSTDGTQDIIKKCMEGVNGQLYERPWVNFAHNRNQALEIGRSKADYIMLIDADETLVFSEDFNKETLSDHYYEVSMIDPDGFTTQRAFMIKSNLSWKWVGAIHENIVFEETSYLKNNLIESVKLINFQDGFRSHDPQKYLKDAALLEEELKKDPFNTRHQFYLAQCYLNGNEKVLALKNYEKRVQMGGSEDEKWYSLYTIARLHEEMNYPFDLINQELSQAYHKRPTRAEPLWHLAMYHLKQGNFIVSYCLTIQGLSLPKPQDSYFVENWIYDWGLLCTYADSLLNLGHKEKALSIYKDLLEKNSLPEDIRNNIVELIAVKTNL
jgi:glycosyltransferase involved in cell wall biosynthesis